MCLLRGGVYPWSHVPSGVYVPGVLSLPGGKYVHPQYIIRRYTPWKVYPQKGRQWKCTSPVLVTKAEGAHPTGMLSLLSEYLMEKHFVWNQFWASPFHLEPPLFFQVDMFGVQATLLAYHLFKHLPPHYP